MNEDCPHLPQVTEPLGPEETRGHAAEKGTEYYLAALRYAQSQWRAGKPAQAILQLNKAWMADLPRDAAVLTEMPPPYRALAWILRRSGSGEAGFLGNPVRHFQHLASRMSGPRSETRAWRAWACFHLAERVLPSGGFPRDGRQIAREGLWIPSFGRALDELANRGWSGEADEAQRAAVS